jgi:outer membrane protein assembly factor BamB
MKQGLNRIAQQLHDPIYRFALTCLMAVLMPWCLGGKARAEDWASWRGPMQNGVSLDTDLPERVGLDPSNPNSNLIWKQPYGGRCAPLVLNGRVYIIGDAGEQGKEREQERVMCFDANTGEVLWQYRFNVFFTDIVSNRVGWADLAADPETGNIYAHGVQGLFFCFDKDGKVLWSHSLTEEYGRISGYGGRINSPTVWGDLVIIGMVNASWGDQARGGCRYLAFNKKTGVPVWWSPTFTAGGTYYSEPVVVAINGELLLITGGSDGAAHALKVRTGEEVWSYKIGLRAVNSSPVVQGTRVYISHGEENLDTNEKGRVVCLDAGHLENGKPKLVWQRNGIRGGYASPVLHEGRLYVCDDTAKMFCLDADSGKTLWTYKYGRTAKGSPVWADGKLYIAEVSAHFHILKPEESRCKELYSLLFPSPTSAVVELNGSPSIANGRIYLTTRDEIYCFGKKDWKGKVGMYPPPPEEAPGDPSAKATHLQVEPADIVLSPGETMTFKARTFDAMGHFLKEVRAEWSLPAPPPPPGAKSSPPPLHGQINGEGQLFVDKMPPGQQGMVLAKAEGLAGHARVRIAPRLPYMQDFEKIPEGAVPGGWVNAAGKFAVVQRENSKVLMKTANNPNPLLARAHAFITIPTATDYTIQTDLLGTRKGTDMPDMGLVANRYTLMLDGNKQRLRIVSWEALPRIDKTIDWPWKPGVWYHMKFMVELEGDKGIVRGKVWERGQEEPGAWSIECEDPIPNREGSPALYGYATGMPDNGPMATCFFDNVRVTPNKRQAAANK